MHPLAGEAAASTGVFVGASYCADCLASWGMDPALAGALAVMLSVLVRAAIAWLASRQAGGKLDEMVAAAVRSELAHLRDGADKVEVIRHDRYDREVTEETEPAD